MTATRRCPLPASYRYRWGDRPIYNYACYSHAEKLAAASDHMDWDQAFERISPDLADKQCEQEVSEDDPMFAALALSNVPANSRE